MVSADILRGRPSA